MTKRNIREISEIAEKILRYKRAYYAGNPLVSDAVYDALEDRLREIDPRHPVLKVVGTDKLSSTQEKVTHKRPMLSLGKTYVVDDLLSWMDGKPIVGTYKIDGNSLSLIYERGDLVLAKTRGDGRIGEKVTEKVVWVHEIPKVVGNGFSGEIRGELYCREDQFLKLAEEMALRRLEKPTNPRNIVAGILGRKADVDLAMYFSFFGFEVFSDEPARLFKEEMDKFAWLEAQGFPIPGIRLCKTEKDVNSYIEMTRALLAEGEFGIDGAVFTFNDLKLHEQLGNTAHHPRYKLSFKWQGATAVSDIHEIIWSTSRLGIVTPVAVINPVNLSGAQITNITLHNAAHVKLYNLKAGDEVELIRSGEVIPKFLRVTKAAKGDFTWPKHCSSCNAKLEFDDVRLLCRNRDSCPAQKLGSILNWIQCVGVDDLSEKRLEIMWEMGLVKNASDLYRLSKEDLLKLPLTKEKMAEKLFNNIQKTIHLPLERFLHGLGIDGAGKTTWAKVTEVFPTLKAIRKVTVPDLEELHGFAEKTAAHIVQGLSDKADIIEELLKVGVHPEESQHIAHDGPLNGMSFVITGALSQPREHFEALIARAGGKVTSSVSKNTKALITNETDSTSSKMKKAKDLGVEIWDEGKLLKVIQK